jgi:hypothetical protein
LNDRHEALREIVEKMGGELANASKNAKVPDDIMQQLAEIKRIKAALENLKNSLAIVYIYIYIKTYIYIHSTYIYTLK